MLLVDTRWWLVLPVGVIDAAIEGDEILWVVEGSSELLEFTIVYLKSGIQRRVILDILDIIRIEPGALIEGFVALLVSLGC